MCCKRPLMRMGTAVMCTAYPHTFAALKIYHSHIKVIK
uniref:Uncharacterized protein n=1 Tax=Anguilla anguilla TaxID=7936 RepID=A0A0E9RR15_ANGAN